MDLILWRHAEAEDLRDGIVDGERVLTPKGRRQATQMAIWLRERLPMNTRVLASPARRTQETATYLGLPYATEPRLAIDQSPAAALQAAGWLQQQKVAQEITQEGTQNGACVLIAHQPMLGKIIGQLLQSTVTDWPITKGGIWWFSIPIDGHSGGCEIKCMLSVKDIESRKQSAKRT